MAFQPLRWTSSCDKSFWRGLRDQQLKNICRHKKDAAPSFDGLVRLVRMGEQESVPKRLPKDLPPGPQRPSQSSFAEALATVNSSIAELKGSLKAPQAAAALPLPPTVRSLPMTSKPPTRPTAPVECYECGQLGHIARGCRNPPKNPNATPLNAHLPPQGVMWQAAPQTAPATSNTRPY